MTEAAQVLRDKTAVQDIKIGMPVEAAYEDITGEITLVQFRPVKR